MDWSEDKRRAVLAIAVAFDQADFVPAKWIVPELRVENGKTIHTLGWPEYDPRVEEFFAAVWADGGDPYEGEPWQAFYYQFFEDPGRFATASPSDLRRFLMILKRRERFGDGTIESAFKRGLVQAAVRRLRELTPVA